MSFELESFPVKELYTNALLDGKHPVFLQVDLRPQQNDESDKLQHTGSFISSTAIVQLNNYGAKIIRPCVAIDTHLQAF